MKRVVLAFIAAFIVQSVVSLAQKPGVLGLSVQPDPTGKTGYYIVMATVSGSASERAGFKSGMRIISFNGKTILHKEFDKMIAPNPFRGFENTKATFVVTGVNDLTTQQTIEVVYDPIPERRMLLIDPPEVSMYFSMRLWNAFDALKNSDPRLKVSYDKQSSSGAKYYKLDGVQSIILNDKLEAVYMEMPVYQKGSSIQVLARSISAELTKDLESNDLAEHYFNTLRDSLKSKLVKVGYGNFSMQEHSSIEKSGTLSWTDKTVVFRNENEWVVNLFKTGSGKSWTIELEVMHTGNPIIDGYPSDMLAQLTALTERLRERKLGVMERKVETENHYTAILTDPKLSWDSKPKFEMLVKDGKATYEVVTVLLSDETDGRKAREWYDMTAEIFKIVYGKYATIAEVKDTIGATSSNPFGSFGNTSKTEKDPNAGLETIYYSCMTSEFDNWMQLKYIGGKWSLVIGIKRYMYK